MRLVGWVFHGGDLCYNPVILKAPSEGLMLSFKLNPSMLWITFNLYIIRDDTIAFAKLALFTWVVLNNNKKTEVQEFWA
jgi:hypothetical protein